MVKFPNISEKNTLNDRHLSYAVYTPINDSNFFKETNQKYPNNLTLSSREYSIDSTDL